MTIPGKELVGKNAQLENGDYTDDYLVALNQFATVDEIFGQCKECIANRERTPIIRLVVGTLGKKEFENHLESLVIAAAKAGKWKAVVREGEYANGLNVVVERNFGYVIKHEDKTFLLPSAIYLKYCKTQLS